MDRREGLDCLAFEQELIKLEVWVVPLPEDAPDNMKQLQELSALYMVEAKIKHQISKLDKDGLVYDKLKASLDKAFDNHEKH